MAGGRKTKKPKHSSSSSGNEEGMAASGEKNGDENGLQHSIDCLKTIVSKGFAKIHADLDILRAEFKSEMKEVKGSIKDIEQSLSFTQGEVEVLKEQLKKESEGRATDTDTLNKKIADLDRRLKKEVENNTNLEQYTRRENLRFNNT